MRGFVFVTTTVVAIGCSIGTINGDDFNDDAGFPDASLPETFCTTSADCPRGTTCGFPINGGCLAQSQCFPTSEGSCKALPVCACDGTTTSACSASPKPVRSTGPCPDEAGTCAPVACANCESDFAPTTMSRPLQSNVCSASEIDAFVTACYGAMASSTACIAWFSSEYTDAGSTPCSVCARSQSDDIHWGASVCNSVACTLNTAGCIDLELGQIAQEINMGGTGSCGDLYATSTECSIASCNSCAMPSTDDDICLAWANANSCQTYVTATQDPNGPCAALYGGDASAPPGLTKCFPQDTAETIAFVNLFCGTGL